MGGNIGLPILGQDPLPEGGVYVLELSSYQIDLTCSLDCDVAVLLNITPDHLDRYDGFDDYAASKARLFAMQSPGPCRGDRGRGRLHQGDRRAGRPAARSSSRPNEVKDQSRWPALQGPHNAQNVAAAVARGARAWRRDDAIARGLATYPGLPHRMERVARGRACCSSTTARRPTRPPPRRRWPPIRRCTGSSAACPRRTISAPASLISAMSAPPIRSARPGRCSRDCCGRRSRSTNAECSTRAVRTRGGRGASGRGGPAVAGLRLVRPVQRL